MPVGMSIIWKFMNPVYLQRKCNQYCAMERRFSSKRSTDEARQIAVEVGTVVSSWRRVAASHGITASEIDRMASAFEHEDLKAAVGIA